MSDSTVVCIIYTSNTVRIMKEVKAKVSGLGANILHSGGEDVVKTDSIFKIPSMSDVLRWARSDPKPSPTYQKEIPLKLDKHNKLLNKPQQKVLREQRCRRYF